MDANKIQMTVLTITQICSFCFTICIFLHFNKRTSPLRQPQNHSLMYLLIVATWTITIELPNTQKYLWTGSASIHTFWFCSLWNLSFLSTATLNRVLMAFMCIERHFFVFRPQTYHTRRSRLIFHYIPSIFIISVVLIYFFITSVLLSCPRMSFNYSLFMCGYTCSVLILNVGTFYAWVFIFVPTALTIVSCVLLPVRFVIQKRQLQRVQWNRARKMIVQTSVIAGLYTICWLPYTIIVQLLVNSVISFSNQNITQFLQIAPYATSLLTPFIVYYIVRKHMNFEFVNRIKTYFCPRQHAVVRPTNNIIAQQTNNLTDGLNPPET